jgi:hypothetical protein
MLDCTFQTFSLVCLGRNNSGVASFFGNLNKDIDVVDPNNWNYLTLNDAAVG